VPDDVPEFGERSAQKRAGEAASAAAALPLILDVVPDVRSLVHVGFGDGAWLAEAQRLGVPEVHGIDGPWATLDGLLVAPERVTIVDTREPFDGGGRTHDLAICVEYAEHLPAARAASFVADLTKLAPVIAFSAAIPGQGGVGHINEQWPSYWDAHFRAVGYRMVDAVRRRLWTATGGPAYLAQNLLIAIDERRLADYPRLADVASREDGGALSLVHPETYDAKRRQLAGRSAVPGVRTATRTLMRALGRSVRKKR
jgi:hypothetical protein